MRNSAGLHVIVDAYVKDSTIFTKETIENLFEKLVVELDMKMLAKPQVYEVDVDPKVLERVKLTGKFEDEGGITAVAVISTSHMSIHCWPLQKFFSLDVFSCKNFNSIVALDIIHTMLGVEDWKVCVLPRSKPNRD